VYLAGSFNHAPFVGSSTSSYSFLPFPNLSLSWTNRKRRLSTGFLTAFFAGFLTYTYLEPLFVPVGSEMAMVFLYILAIYSASVGMSLGVLLPLLFPGVCFGGAVGLMVATFMDMNNGYVFPVSAAVLAVVFAFCSAR